MTTLQKNFVGELNTVVRSPKSAPSFDGQKYVPTQYLFDAELNEWVSFYWVDVPFRSNNGGAQCLWLANNAEEEHPLEFGIKLTAQNIGEGKAKAAAFAMYQRQKAAAEESCAPPVHGMCCFKYYNKDRRHVTTYWGYLSSVAGSVGEVDTCPDAEEEYENYRAIQQDRWDKLNEIESILNDMDIYTNRILQEIVGQIGPSPDDIDFYEWCDENGYCQYAGLSQLRRTLENIDISHVQNDWQPIGTPGYNRCMGSDLHSGNLGYWGGKLVCIDFGYHCVE